MRGKAGRLRGLQTGRGITPACAGKRKRNQFSRVKRGDHPRMCGEKAWVGESKNNETGSPPHVRGKGKLDGQSPQGTRITPACAGKSILVIFIVFHSEDHPRMCGEKQGKPTGSKKWAGSPPHVRGKELQHGFEHFNIGITPACAGKRLKRSRSTVLHAAIVPLFPSVCNKPAGSDGSPAGHDAPPSLPIENAAPASPAYNLRSL